MPEPPPVTMAWRPVKRSLTVRCPRSCPTGSMMTTGSSVNTTRSSSSRGSWPRRPGMASPASPPSMAMKSSQDAVPAPPPRPTRTGRRGGPGAARSGTVRSPNPGVSRIRGAVLVVPVVEEVLADILLALDEREQLHGAPPGPSDAQLLNQWPALDTDHLAGHGLGQVRGEVHRGPGDLLGVGQVAEARLPRHLVVDLLERDAPLLGQVVEVPPHRVAVDVAGVDR